MPRKSPPQFDRAKSILYGVVLGLVLVLVILLVNRTVANRIAPTDTSRESRVSLGSMTYNFSSEKAIKREDETVKSLRTFLVSLAEKDEKHDCESYFNVIKASVDEAQVLLEYGCPYPNARMFAVNEGGKWRTLSPTNNFDQFSIPACEHVNENNIHPSIAPVCASGMLNTVGPQEVTYNVR